MLNDIIREFLENTSIHGLKYLVDKKIHWSERIFWLSCLLISWYGSSILILASWNAFKYNPISFVVETTYKDWNTQFPSIAVCEIENNDRIEEASDKLWTPEHDFNLEEVLKEIAFYKGVSYFLIQFCANEDSDIGCPSKNFTHYANMKISSPFIHSHEFQARSNCEEMLSNCTWADDLFDCCEYFLPIDTELGPCYVINSIQRRDPNGKMLPMDNNRLTGPRGISMNVHVPANVYIIGREEVPALTSLTSDILVISGNIHYKRHISMRTIENDHAAKEVSAEQRRCHYHDENPPSVYRYHSYSACTVQCRKDAQLDICNCTNFFMPNTSDSLHCDIKGLMCLHDHYGELSVLRAAWGTRAGLYCNCQPSCTETDITVIADDRTAASYAHSHVEIVLDYLPTERYRRNVVRGPLDLVVSMGGTAGLFLGASILSFVELPYFLLIRGCSKVIAKEDLPVSKSKIRSGWREKLSEKFRYNTPTTERLRFTKKSTNGISKRIGRRVVAPATNRLLMMNNNTLKYKNRSTFENNGLFYYP